MTSFREKPVIIQAVQWTGSNISEVTTFTGGGHDVQFGKSLVIFSADKELRVREGNWIIKDGEDTYAVTDKDFKEEFERVSPA